MTATYLYRPPTWRNVQQIVGSLRYGVPTSTCVYRRGGVWMNVQVASEQDVTGIDVWTSPFDPGVTLRLFFTKPTVVPGDLYAALAALKPADPSWTPGVLVDLTTI